MAECLFLPTPRGHPRSKPLPSPELTEQAVRDHCAQVLTGYKRPRVIVFRPDLPKTPIGKVLRRALREEAASQSERELTEAPSA